MSKRRNNLLKVVGFIGAALLVVFGGLNNLLRTVKFALKKSEKKG